jgi:hypothetical protein
MLARQVIYHWSHANRQNSRNIDIDLFWVFLVGVGFELTASCPHLVHFALLILETGSHEIFAWVGLQPRSS